MDYKDLANLIFPDVKEITYYEDKYSERNLDEGAIVTRFAPINPQAPVTRTVLFSRFTLGVSIYLYTPS